jgi:glyoxylase-like metal-dependent hydrolase (beta-lactamase superfamily II)
LKTCEITCYTCTVWKSDIIDFSATDSPIIVSGHLPRFIRKDVLPITSECAALGLDVPDYDPILVNNNYPIKSHAPASQPLGVRIFHSPGHTPDEISLFDENEMMLYVGDTLYEWEPIIFPAAGSIVTWFASMRHLVALVQEQNMILAARAGPGEHLEVLINAGHVTALRPALDVLLATVEFMKDVVEGREELKDRFMKRGVVTVKYEQDGGRFSLICPERLVTDARWVYKEGTLYVE